MITVIIPALNEEETICEVVQYAAGQPGVTEVIVVDDKSLDATVQKATQAGAKVITSTKLGKGASMKDGLLCAKNNIVVFLDADIHPYPEGTIAKLTDPIVQDSADFVKACFSRNAGRVTELVAKPLLNILFPELAHFEQPLSGMIAGKKEFLAHVHFYDDYGVDIGLLIDMHLMKARITEVNIGYIENNSKPWQELGKMSREVARAILSKANHQQKNEFNLEEFRTMSMIRDQMEFAIKESLMGLEKMAAIDMDNTLLMGRFIDTCAEKFGFVKELIDIRSMDNDAIITTKNIARLMKGITLSEVLEVADSIPMVPDAVEVITELKDRGYVVGLISDSYDIVVNHIMRKAGADFSLSNELEFSNSVATGEVKLPSFFFNQPGALCRHTLCKTHALEYILNRYGIRMNNTIAVGDSANDLCMVRHAGVGVAFRSGNELLNAIADKKITEPSFRELLSVA